MELRAANIDAFFQDLRTDWNNAIQGASPVYEQVAIRTTSTTETNLYAWAEQLPQFRKWVGTRVFQNLKSNKYSLTNDDYEFSLGIDTNKLEDDTYGIYSNYIEQAAVNGAYLHDVHVFDLMNNGFTDTCWDGKAFFAADHPWKPDANGDATTLNNLSDLALSFDNFWTVRAALKQNLQGGDNPFMGREPELLLIVGTDLEKTGTAILENDYNELGATNSAKGKAKLMVNAQLDDGKWILQVTNNPLKPFMVQVRKEIEVKDNRNSPEVDETRQFKFMCHGRFAYGYTLPALAYGSTGTA